MLLNACVVCLCRCATMCINENVELREEEIHLEELSLKEIQEEVEGEREEEEADVNKNLKYRKSIKSPSNIQVVQPMQMGSNNNSPATSPMVRSNNTSKLRNIPKSANTSTNLKYSPNAGEFKNIFVTNKLYQKIKTRQFI